MAVISHFKKSLKIKQQKNYLLFFFKRFDDEKKNSFDSL